MKNRGFWELHFKTWIFITIAREIFENYINLKIWTLHGKGNKNEVD